MTLRLGGTLAVDCHARQGELTWAPASWPIDLVDRCGWVQCDQEAWDLVPNAPDCTD